MNRLLFSADEVDASGKVILRDGRFLHVRDVLRAIPGDAIRAGLIGGSRYEAELCEMAADFCVIRLGKEQDPLPVPRLDLLLALPRPKCLKRLWPQLAAIGVRRLFIVNAEKVEKNYWGSHLLDPEEYEPLIMEGLAQAGDTRWPEIRMVRRLKPLVEDELRTAYSDRSKVVAHPPRGNEQPEMLRFAPTDSVLLAIGPEGGWSAYELAMFEASGFQRLGIGERTLRSDTACIALIAIVNQMLSGGVP